MLGLLYFLDSTVMVQSDSFKVLLSYLIFIEASFLFSGNEISKVQKTVSNQCQSRRQLYYDVLSRV